MPNLEAVIESYEAHMQKQQATTDRICKIAREHLGGA